MAESFIPQLLEAYDPEQLGDFRQAKAITIGLIHQTYRVDTSAGSFSFQGLHPKLATDGILHDYEAVLEHLAAKNFPAPRLLKTREEQSFVTRGETRWRLTTWLDGLSTSTVESPQMVRSAAAFLGRFHRAMADIDYGFQSTHPLHDTPHHLRRLEEALVAHAGSPWREKIQAMVDEVQAQLPGLLLPEDIPKRVVHGDPKISNILFDEGDLSAVGMIDLDTCTRHSVLVDIGDAVRSWCRGGGEDQSEPFAVDRYRALLEGYASQGPALEASEIALLPRAGRMITLELTARFLTDVLEDSYFAWDAEAYASRRDHNFARSQSMLQLARDMERAGSQCADIAEELYRDQGA